MSVCLSFRVIKMQLIAHAVPPISSIQTPYYSEPKKEAMPQSITKPDHGLLIRPMWKYDTLLWLLTCRARSCCDRTCSRRSIAPTAGSFLVIFSATAWCLMRPMPCPDSGDGYRRLWALLAGMQETFKLKIFHGGRLTARDGGPRDITI